MEFEQQEIQNYIALYAKHFDEVLTPEQAESQIRQFIEFYFEIAELLPKHNQNKTAETET